VNRFKQLLIAGIALMSSFFIQAEADNQALKNRMMSDLDVIQNVFEVSYAPREWKKSFAGWDLYVEIQKAKDQIQSADHISIKAFQKIARSFFNSTKDYHVGVWFYSTESAHLPFKVQGAQGRYFIANADHSRLNSTVYPFEVGDEVLLFDGQPAGEAIAEIMQHEFRSANEATDKAFAEYILTNRFAKLGQTVPRGPLSVTLKHAASGEAATYQLIWNYTPEKISNGFLGSMMDPERDLQDNQRSFLAKGFNKKMTTPLYEILKEDSSLEKAQDFIGAKESWIPPLGRIWWENSSKSSFKAYIYETKERQLIGYVRIPHFMGMDSEVKEFGSILEFFKKRTDALVIDQLNNPGGYVFYAYALASMLTNDPLQTPKHRMTITHADIAHAVSAIPILEGINSDVEAQALLGGKFFGMTVTHQMTQFLLNYLQFILSEWNEGRTLTNPYFLYSIDHINPHPRVRYTKPILLLINSLDMSCGDFFPAILQDNKRVTTFGTRTAGAGGYFVPESFPNRFGIAGFSYTGSIAERADKSPIENLGVTPDIPYEVTVEDLQNNYQDYVEAVNQAMSNILQGQL
jgi:PDZ domain/Peptidase family S41